MVGGYLPITLHVLADPLLLPEHDQLHEPLFGVVGQPDAPAPGHRVVPADLYPSIRFLILGSLTPARARVRRRSVADIPSSSMFMLLPPESTVCVSSTTGRAISRRGVEWW